MTTAKATKRVLTADALVKIGTAHRGEERERQRHADVLRRAREAAKAIGEALPRWLAALEDPRSREAYGAILGFDMLLTGKRDGVPDIITDATSFAGCVSEGIARVSHGSRRAPECPGIDGLGKCGAPVAKGHRLCAGCEVIGGRP